MRIREKIFALIPDTDDLPDDAAVLAQNALIALSYLYDFVLNPNPEYATQLRCLSLIGAGAALGELHAFAASHCVPCD